jgi:hypothetical protein
VTLLIIDLPSSCTHVVGILQQHSDMSAGDAQQVAHSQTPVAAQLVAGPLALCGFDCYTTLVRVGWMSNHGIPTDGTGAVSVPRREPLWVRAWQGFARIR